MKTFELFFLIAHYKGVGGGVTVNSYSQPDRKKDIFLMPSLKLVSQDNFCHWINFIRI